MADFIDFEAHFWLYQLRPFECPSCGFDSNPDLGHYCGKCGRPLDGEYSVIPKGKYNDLAKKWYKVLHIIDEIDKKNNSKIFPNKEMKLFIERFRKILSGSDDISNDQLALLLLEHPIP